MKIAGKYSFNGGLEYINNKYPRLVKEIEDAILRVDSSICRTKASKEKTKSGKMLYSPVDINKQFKKHLYKQNWKPRKVKCDYPTKYYTEAYKPISQKD